MKTSEAPSSILSRMLSKFPSHLGPPPEPKTALYVLMEIVADELAVLDQNHCQNMESHTHMVAGPAMETSLPQFAIAPPPLFGYAPPPSAPAPLIPTPVDPTGPDPSFMPELKKL